MFLDVVCIMKGWQKETAIKALECCGFHARNGLRVLQQKSLITIYNYNHVGMHDHIEEMGRNIVRRSHPNKPHKHSRSWKIDEIENILANDLGSKATRCVRFYTEKLNQHILIKGLSKMKELRFIFVVLGDCFRNLEFNIANPTFPNTLQYLHFTSYPFGSLPNTFQANNLVALEMVGSKIIQLWEGDERKVLNKLKFLNLSCSLLRTFDLWLTPNLEMLNLGGCSNLVVVHMPFGCLKLISVDIRRSGLRTLDVGVAPNLETLILVECCDLVELHMPGKYVNLRNLQLTNSKVKNLDIGLTPNLKHLDLQNSYCLEELHMAGECLKLTELDISYSKFRTLDIKLTPNLTELDMKECCNLAELHIPIGCLKRLVHLRLSGGLSFSSFLFNIKHYPSFIMDEAPEVGPLAELHLIAESLERCPRHPNNTLPKFRFSCIYEEDGPLSTGNLEILNSARMCACSYLETFSGSLCRLQRLRTLKLEGGILEAPKDLDQLESLQELIFSYTKIKHIPDSIFKLKNLTSLKLESCLLLEMLPKDLGQLKCLEKLIVSSATIKQLPDSICMLKHLKLLELTFCWLLEKLPEDLDRLENLKKLNLSSAKIKYLPDSIQMLKNLKSLKLNPCLLLEKLPEDLGRLECLEELTLSSTMIKHLPDSICMLKHLKSLILISCSLLEKLPKDLGQLECLEKLDLSYTKIKHLPGSICMLKQLRFLKLDHCLSLENLPEELGYIESLQALSIHGTNISHLP